jgi:hypothetical protein
MAPKQLPPPTDEDLDRIKEYFIMVGSSLYYSKDHRKKKAGDKAGTKQGNSLSMRFLYRTYKVSRVAYFLQTNEWPESLVIDHIDGDGTNNHISNLRAVSNEDNLRAFRKSKRGKTSQYRGVSLWKNSGREKTYWIARYCHDGDIKVLGYFDTEEGAAMAWDKEAIRNGRGVESLNFSSAYMKEKLL